MQIDSHTIFEKDWDSKLIQTLNELPPKSCLTQYLPDYNIGEFKTTPKCGIGTFFPSTSLKCFCPL